MVVGSYHPARESVCSSLQVEHPNMLLKDRHWRRKKESEDAAMLEDVELHDVVHIELAAPRGAVRAEATGGAGRQLGQCDDRENCFTTV